MRTNVLAAVTAALVATGADACTTVAISGAASADGTPMTMHTTDCSECDFRLALVPGRYHPAGAMKAIYGVAAVYPRFKSNRATIYENVDVDPKPLAYIPEVNYTYGVWESSYTLMNEVGLTFGESSCSSKITAAGVDMPDPSNGKLGEAYFSIAALMQLGLERCATAVCAIKTIGALAEQYGFYGESFMGGESLTMADTTGDAWIFHVQQDFSTNKSAIWVAQRVPDGHIAVIANEFTIQDVPEEQTSDFLFSSNLRSEAVAAGFWDGNGPFNFQQVYGTKSVVGDNLYATLREQWIYNKAAPSLGLDLVMSPSQYKSTYPVDEKLTLESAIELLRGHYEGTEWDLSKGILAGPFGNPKRVEGGLGLKEVKGQLPRGISIPRTSHVHVGYAHRTKPAAFYGPDEPATTVFAPFLMSTLVEARKVPLKKTADLYSSFYQNGRRDVFSRSSAWWAFDLVANKLNFNYANMTGEYVNPAIRKWQKEMFDAYEIGTTEAVKEAQNRLVKAWWELNDLLIVRYNDGTFNYYPGHDPKKPATTFGYPTEWLKDVGFGMDWWKTQTVQGQIAKACKHDSDVSTSFSTPSWLNLESPVISHLLSGLTGVMIGLIVAKCIQRSKRNEESYSGPLLSGYTEI